SVVALSQRTTRKSWSLPMPSPLKKLTLLANAPGRIVELFTDRNAGRSKRSATRPVNRAKRMDRRRDGLMRHPHTARTAQVKGRLLPRKCSQSLSQPKGFRALELACRPGRVRKDAGTTIRGGTQDRDQARMPFSTKPAPPGPSFPPDLDGRHLARRETAKCTRRSSVFSHLLAE